MYHTSIKLYNPIKTARKEVMAAKKKAPSLGCVRAHQEILAKIFELLFHAWPSLPFPFSDMTSQK